MGSGRGADTRHGNHRRRRRISDHRGQREGQWTLRGTRVSEHRVHLTHAGQQRSDTTPYIPPHCRRGRTLLHRRGPNSTGMARGAAIDAGLRHRLGAGKQRAGRAGTV